MRRVAVLMLAAVLVVGAMFLLPGCAGKKPVTETITDEGMSEDASALTGEDLPLTDAGDTIYVEPLSSAFENIHFDFDKYDIRHSDEAILQGIAEWLKDNDNVSLLIEGNCDERGTNEYNMALGEQRALAARRYLVGLGIPAERITTISYGEERPLDPRSNEEAWAKNRRDHFTVSE